jgi:hypothetical protein
MAVSEDATVPLRKYLTSSTFLHKILPENNNFQKFILVNPGPL